MAYNDLIELYMLCVKHHEINLALKIKKHMDEIVKNIPISTTPKGNYP